MKSIKLPFLICLTVLLFNQIAFAQPGDYKIKQGFSENKGQWQENNTQVTTPVLFHSTNHGVDMIFRKSGVSFVFSKKEKEKDQQLHKIDLLFENTNPNVSVTGKDACEGTFNYYVGGQLDKPVTGVQKYQKLVYQEIYAGIDMEIFFETGELKYNFIVHPGANPNAIKLNYSEHFSAQGKRTFSFKHDLGSIEEKGLKALQNGKEIGCDYVYTNQSISYKVGAYDAAQTLIIDPFVMLYSTYFGGNGGDAGGSEYLHGTVDVGPDQAIYITGTTNSTTGLASAGAYQTTYQAGSADTYIAKFNAAGTLLWATYYGGSDFETSSGIEVGSDGSAYVVGTTMSNGMATAGSHDAVRNSTDAFIAKFTSGGMLIWSTYYGGSSGDDANDIEIDYNDNIFVCGVTNSSSDMATAGAFQSALGSGNDGYLVKFNTAGVRIWGTYFGGTSGVGGSGSDKLAAIALDKQNGFIYGTGITTSVNNFATPGAHQSTYAFGPGDAFLVKFDVAGNRIWSTFYGANNRDEGKGIAVDDDGNVYFTGYTYVPSNPLAIATAGSHQPNYGGGINDSYLVKFLPDGTRAWGTYYGGSDGENGQSVVTSGCYVYISGHTLSGNNIATPDGYINVFSAPNRWGYFAKFTQSGVRKWGSYFGATTGSSEISALAFDTQAENLHLFGNDASGTLATPGANQTTMNGGSDAILVKIHEQLETVNLGNDVVLCPGQSTVLDAGFIAGATYAWRLNGVPTGQTTQTITVSNPGIYCVTVFNVDGCEIRDCIQISVQQYNLTLVNPTTGLCPNSTLCFTANVVLVSGPASTQNIFSWDFNDGLQTGTQVPTTCHHFNNPGTYPITLTMYSSQGCTYTTSTNLIINPPPTVTIVGNSSICAGSSTTLFALTSGLGTYTWTSTPSDASLAGQIHASFVNVSPNVGTTYTLTYVDENGCTNTTTFHVTVNLPPHIQISSSNGDHKFCPNSPFSLTATFLPGASYLWTLPNGTTVNASNTLGGSSINLDGNYCVQVTDANGCIGQACFYLEKVNLALNIGLPIGTHCENSQMCFLAQISIISGSGATNPDFSWDFGDGTPLSSSNCHTYANAGTYTVTVTMTTAEGCEFTASTTVSLVDGPSVTISASEDFLCPLSTVDLTAYSSTAISYLWSTGQTGTDITVSIGGNYTVTVFDDNGCSAQENIFITPPIKAASVVDATCPGGSYGSIHINVIGGTQPYTYSWSDDPLAQGPDRTLLPGGTYTVTIMDANNCILVKSVVVNEVAPTFDFYLNDLCQGDACNPHHVILMDNIQFGESPYNFSSNIGQVVGDEVTLNYSDVGESGATLTVEMEDFNGCIATQSIFIPGLNTVNGTPSIAAGGFTYSNGSWCINVENATRYKLEVYDNGWGCYDEPIYEHEEEFEIENPCDVDQLKVCFSEGNAGVEECYGMVGYYILTLYDCNGNDWEFDGDINGGQVGNCDCCCGDGSSTEEGTGMGVWCDDCFEGIICTPNGTAVDVVHKNELISKTTNWKNETHYVEGTLRIASGRKLNIQNSTVIFSEGAGIIIEPGANIIVNKSILKSCEFVKWKGIEIRGIAGTNQHGNVQGRIDVTESIIRDADIALFVGARRFDGTIDPNGAGGIVSISKNSKMENNGTHIYITAYAQEMDLFSVSNTTFDQSSLNRRLDASKGHIFIEEARGLRLLNNIFKGGQAGITIEGGSDIKLEQNLLQGIISMIQISKASNFTVSNVFEKGKEGIVLRSCDNFILNQNQFNDVSFPIHTSNSKSGLPSSISNNNFFKAENAIVFEKDDHRSLTISCNVFDQYNRYGIYSDGTYLGNIGSVQTGSGNHFNSASKELFNYIKHTGNDAVYYYAPSEAAELLKGNLISLNLLPAQAEENCILNPKSLLVTEQVQPISINVSPNPTNGNLSVAISQKSDELLYFELLDMAGRKVLATQKKALVDSFDLNLKNFEAGTYILKVFNEKHFEIQSIKVVVQ